MHGAYLVWGRGQAMRVGAEGGRVLWDPRCQLPGAAKPDSRPRAPAVCAASAAGVDLGAHIGGAIRLKYMSGRRAGQVRTVTLVRKIRLAGGPAWKVREVWGEEYDYYGHHMRDLVVVPDSRRPASQPSSASGVDSAPAPEAPRLRGEGGNRWASKLSGFCFTIANLCHCERIVAILSSSCNHSGTSWVHPGHTLFHPGVFQDPFSVVFKLFSSF